MYRGTLQMLFVLTGMSVYASLNGCMDGCECFAPVLETLTTPATAGSPPGPFRLWRLDGVDQSAGQTSLSVTMHADRTAAAVYEPCPGANRDLPDCHDPGQALAVTITIVPPPGTFAVGLEDVPPDGWLVSDISNSGEWDEVNKKVKWGPFFAPFPERVSYTATPPADEAAAGCFAGTVSFDGSENEPISGDKCMGPCH